MDDESLDAELRDETDEALALTGKDVGTPIIHFQPPDGVAFFGPVISRLPSEADAGQLWDHVVGLAGFPGFAELKRSLRERPQLGQLRGDLRPGWRAGGLARRQPSGEEVAFGRRAWTRSGCLLRCLDRRPLRGGRLLFAQ